MGKGKIVSGGLDGKYNVAIKRKRTRILFEISMLKTQQEQIIKKLFGMEDGPRYDALQLQLTAVKKKIAFLDKSIIYGEDEVKEAWCADLTENLSGDVGTMEVPGELGKLMIRPGYNSQAVYDADRDGQLGNVWEAGPAATFVNLALLPGWQKWMPTYRFGTITAIDYAVNMCDVQLDDAKSSQQSINVNASIGFASIPVKYMHCHAGAFQVGDKVVLEYMSQDPYGARVIGFKDHPRACSFKFKLTRDTTVNPNPVKPYVGDLVTPALFPAFTVKKSTGIEIPTTWTYDAVTHYWQGVLDNPITDADPHGYWVSYVCSNSLPTQYPFSYKSCDLLKAENLIPIGTYEDHLPYYAWSYVDLSGSNYVLPGGSMQQSVKITCSVPYKVKYYAKGMRSMCEFSGSYKGWDFDMAIWNLDGLPPDYFIVANYNIHSDNGLMVASDSFQIAAFDAMCDSIINTELIVDHPGNMAEQTHTIYLQNTAAGSISFPVWVWHPELGESGEWIIEQATGFQKWNFIQGYEFAKFHVELVPF